VVVDEMLGDVNVSFFCGANYLLLQV